MRFCEILQPRDTQLLFSDELRGNLLGARCLRAASGCTTEMAFPSQTKALPLVDREEDALMTIRGLSLFLQCLEIISTDGFVLEHGG